MNWRKVKLGEVLTHRKEFITINDGEEYKRCRVQVNRKGVVLRDIVKGSAINTKKQQLCKAGDFLVAEIDAKVGGYGFVGKELEGAIVSSHYFLFDVDETKMLKEYLGWLIKTDIIQEQINSKGSTNYAAIRPKNVLDFEIPLPDTISQQGEIVQRLNAAHVEYSLLQSEIEKQESYLQVLRQTILKEAVQGKLTEQNLADEPASELLKRIKAEKQKLIKEGKLRKEKELPPIAEKEIPFALPEGWIWCRMGEVSKLQNGYAFQSSKYQKQGIRLVRNINICHGNINWEDTACYPETLQGDFKDFLLYENDILISLDRPLISTGLKIARVTSADMPSLLLQRVARINSQRLSVNADYIYLWFTSSLFIDKINPGRSNGVPHISTKEVESLLFPLPPFYEQLRIVAKVQALQQKLNNLQAQVEQSLNYAEQLLQTVLREAFTDKAKVYEMNDEMSIAAEN